MENSQFFNPSRCKTIISWDERRDLISLPTPVETIAFAVEHWVHTAQRAIQQRGRFAVALSGGSTPKAIYTALAQTEGIDWPNVWLFWGDERAVPPDHPDSNYQMAMEAGLKNVPIPKEQIFRMVAEKEREKQSREYEELIRHHLDKNLFDLVMLGMGEDGHTASLFPKSGGLAVADRLVIPNFAGKEKGWRMTLTFPCINRSSHAVFYVIGPAKKEMVKTVLDAPIDSPWPASRIGTPEHKALWILDKEAASILKK